MEHQTEIVNKTTIVTSDTWFTMLKTMRSGLERTAKVTDDEDVECAAHRLTE